MLIFLNYQKPGYCLTFDLAKLNETNQEEFRETALTTLSKQPGYIPALMVLARTHEMKREFADAQSTYEKILKINPFFSLANKHLAKLFLNYFKDYEKAYKHIIKAREQLSMNDECTDILATNSLSSGVIMNGHHNY